MYTLSSSKWIISLSQIKQRQKQNKKKETQLQLSVSLRISAVDIMIYRLETLVFVD